MPNGCVYSGAEIAGFAFVHVDGKPLDPRYDLRKHSPTGFAWGYLGSGPAQLSLAILAHHLEDDDRACRLYQDFKRLVVAGLPPREPWALTSQDIDRELARLGQG